MRRPAGLRSAAVPVRPARPLRADRAAHRRRARRPLDRHAVRSAAAAVLAALADVRHRARRTRRASARSRCARRSQRWIDRRFGVDVPATHIAACVGTKEFVGTLPQWLQLRTPDPRHGAVPGGRLSDLRDGRRCWPAAGRSPVPSRPTGASTSPRSIPTTRRGRCAVGQQPGQPDRSARRSRRRRRVGSRATACRCSPTSATSSSRGTGRARTILEHGLDGVVAVHSLSKRSNLAGLRVGFYAGDPELVALPAGGAQARRDDGARPGPGRRRRGARRRRPRRGPA